MSHGSLLTAENDAAEADANLNCSSKWGAAVFEDLR
jgi:hypothetical protein